MKKQILGLLISIISFTSIAQIEFEKGYFINNEGQKTQCLIRNSDLKDNPTKFQYRLTAQEDSKTASIDIVREFGFANGSKFIRKTVSIDRSSDVYANLSRTKNVDLKVEQLFLKVLVEGKANLFYYKEGSLRRLFYSVDTSKVEQLVYKKYRNKDDKVGENTRFRGQLWRSLKCENISLQSIEGIGYKRQALEKLFIKYNICVNDEYTVFDKKEKRNLFHLTIRLGVSKSSLDFEYLKNNGDFNNKVFNFGENTQFRFGVEAEYILPFNKNKWAVLIEPTYQSFQSDQELEYYIFNPIAGRFTKTATVNVDYKSIEIPVGIRHYSFLNSNSKLFFNLSVIFDVPLSNSIYAEDLYSNALIDLEIEPRLNLGFGIGYKYKNKYSLEFRTGTRRELLGGNFNIWRSEYNNLSLIFGYSIF